MSKAVGHVGLIAIDSESGDAAYFCLVEGPGALNLTKVGDRPAWFCVDLGQSGRAAGRALLQEIYLAQSTGEKVIVSYESSQPDTGVLVSGCYHAASVQLLPAAERSDQPVSRRERGVYAEV